jgi:membrane associated rhomboid family serine protease
VRAEAPLRRSRSRRRALDWALVLEAAGIPYVRSSGAGGWELRVALEDTERAQQTLDAYDEESVRPAAVESPWAKPYGQSLIGVATALALIAFYAVTGPAEDSGAWFRLGSSAAERIFQGEVWRVVTALTLHADATHLFGNLLACLVFITLLGNRLGPGLALSLTVLAGASGNLLTAAVTRDHHVSLGASTATFAALGALVGLRAAVPFRAISALPLWTALGAGAALLGMLGTGTGADVLAHFFGLVCGGAFAAAFVLSARPLRSRLWQGLLGAAAAVAVVACWSLAFRLGNPI